MRRRTAGSQGEGVSLFPFLAVLLCTMGALVVLLVVLSETSRRKARSSNLAAAEAEANITEAQWRLGVIADARTAASEALIDVNRQLAYFEEQVRQAERALVDLETRIKNQLVLHEEKRERQTEIAAQQRLRLQAELDELQQQRDDLLAELEQLEAEPVERPKAYAVTPYLGRYATFRRPIFIECRSDGVVLQPEGVLFKESDFAGSLGALQPAGDRHAGHATPHSGGNRQSERRAYRALPFAARATGRHRRVLRRP